MKIRLKSDIDTFELDVNRSNGSVQIKWKDAELNLNESSPSPGRYLLNHDGQIINGYAIRDKDRVFVHVLGRNWVFDDVSREGDAGRFNGSGVAAVDQIVAPMPGSVIKVLVAVGDAVKANQPLVIVEAMKMENEVTAPADAVVSEILVTAGQQVGAAQPLLKFAAPQQDEG